MTDRTAIIRLNELHNDDLPEIVQRNPDLIQLIESLQAMSPEAAEAWKEEVRQSRLNDWDDEGEVNPLAETFDGKEDNEQEDDGTNEV